MEVLPPLSQESLPGGAFISQHLGNDVGEDLDQFRLALAQRLLVGNLVKIAGSLASLAVEAADRQVDLLQGAKTLSICLVWTSPGRCSITPTRIPVPTLVGQAVR